MDSAFGVGTNARNAFVVALLIAGSCAVPEEPIDPGDGDGTTGGTGTAGESSEGGRPDTQGGTAGSLPVAGTAGREEIEAGADNEGGAPSAGSGGSAGTAAGRGGAGGTATGGGGTAGRAQGGTAMGGSSAGTAGKGGAGGTGGGAAGGGVGGKAGSGGTDSGGKGGSGGTGACSGVTACLVHRYSFGGSGTTATDAVGSRNGTVVNATIQGGGVTLSGGTSDQYVNLPTSIFSGLTSATFEVWVTWSGGAQWQRIFDFGDNDGAGPGSQGSNGRSYLFVTPKAVNSTGFLRVAYSPNNGPANETAVTATETLPSGTRTHVAVVVDDATDSLRLYLDGASAGEATLAAAFGSLNIENAWLGRSQFSGDPEFGGTIHEFRVYATARTAAQIQASHMAGPDAVPTN